MKSKSQLKARPRVSAARAAAFDILLRTERDVSYAPELLHSRAYDQLTTVDHSLVTELVMGVLRWRSRLDARIAEASSQPLAKLDLEVLTALRLAVYQLGWLTRVPARAAINESVELVKRARKHSAASFVNAVLRKLASGISPDQALSQVTGASAETLADESSHPLWLVERWVNAYGLDSARGICRFNQSIPVTAIRLRNPEAESQLRSEGIELAPGALLASARRVAHGDIPRTSVFRAGGCVIQDEASQLVAALVGKGANILDCCAAPGGKTSAMADRNPGVSITAVDLHPHRARLLRKLINDSSADHRDVRVIAADARALPFTATFDRVLADVPCSGTGTLSRNPEIKWRLKQEDLQDLQARQRAILRSAMDRVASGGRVIYSTCSLEKEENEDVIESALAENSSFRVVDCGTQLDQRQKAGDLIRADISSLVRDRYLRTLPGVQPCDGFFAAILEKI